MFHFWKIHHTIQTNTSHTSGTHHTHQGTTSQMNKSKMKNNLSENKLIIIV